MSTYLVTGGAGFIGSHIVDRLVSEGQTVRILDDLSTGSMGNIEHVLDHVEFIRGDVSDLETVRNSMAGVDYVFHEAAIASVAESVADPVGSNAVGITGTLNVLCAARDVGVRRVVYASSAAVYGNEPTLPKTETMPLDPMSPYAITKLTGEHYMRVFSELYDLETVALRYFNVYGIRQDPSSEYSGVIAIFASAISGGRIPVVYGDGLQSRDFVYVGDVVEANMVACHVDGISGKVFNVGSGQSSTILDLIANLSSILGSGLSPVFGESRLGDVRHSLSDISKAGKMLGFRPSVSMREGLVRLLESQLRLVPLMINQKGPFGPDF